MLIDYNNYIIPFKMKIIYTMLSSLAVFGISYLFYRSIILGLLVSPFGIIYLKYKKKRIIDNRRTELNLQFKDLLISLGSSLSAGKALENAFENALDDLYVLYPSDETYIIKETKIIINKLALNITVEDAISDFARRSEIDDIKNFADVILICKRSGGNLIDAIKNSCNLIGDKIEMKQEIEVMLSARKFEQKILNLMPIGMIIILSLTADEYINPVFTTMQGRFAMTVCLLLLIIAFKISNKIMAIKM